MPNNPLPGTIPALTPYQPGALPISGQEAVEIVSTLSATTAASYSMKIVDLVGKAPSAMPSHNPSPNDLIAVYNVASQTPVSVQLGNLGVVSGGLPIGGTQNQLLAKNSTTNFDASWYSVNSFIVAGAGISIAGTSQIIISSINATGIGHLPTGGTAGQVLIKNTAVNFDDSWGSLNSLIIAGSGISIAGSTTLTLSATNPIGTSAGLSVLGVAGVASALATTIVGSAAQVLRVSDGGGVLGFGAVNLASSAAITGILPGANVTAANLAVTGAGGVQGTLPVTQGGTNLTSLTASAVMLGNGASSVQFATVGTGGRVLIDQGSASPAFTVIGGDLTLTAGGTATIGTGLVTNLKLATVAASSFLANSTAATAVVTNVTGTTATQMLAPFVASGVSHAKGLVPDPGVTAGTTKFLREDATWVTQRSILTTSLTYFIANSGSDSANSGLSTGSPFKTMQHAYTTAVGTLDFGGQNVVIKLLDGTYTSALTINSPWTGGGSLAVQGNATTAANTIVSGQSISAFLLQQTVLPGPLTIQDLKVTTTMSGYGILHAGAGQVNVNNVEFGACADGHMITSFPGAFLDVIGNYTISGSAPTHMFSSGFSEIQCINGLTVTLNGTPAFTVFAQSSQALINVGTVTYSGSATGARYASTNNAVINVNGQGTTFFPGNAAGTTSNGGLYI